MPSDSNDSGAVGKRVFLLKFTNIFALKSEACEPVFRKESQVLSPLVSPLQINLSSSSRAIGLSKILYKAPAIISIFDTDIG